jgi:hypothetical protein
MTRSYTLGRRTLVVSTGQNTADKRFVKTTGHGITMRAFFPARRLTAVLITRAA